MKPSFALLVASAAVLPGGYTQEQQNKLEQAKSQRAERKRHQGVPDGNPSMVATPGEEKVHFEIGDYARDDLFFENPHRGLSQRRCPRKFLRYSPLQE